MTSSCCRRARFLWNMLRDQARNGDRFAHAAQAQQLSAAKRPWPWRCAQNVELRQRVQARLNKGEAKNALARAVFFNRLGDAANRSFEQQRYRARGLKNCRYKLDPIGRRGTEIEVRRAQRCVPERVADGRRRRTTLMGIRPVAHGAASAARASSSAPPPRRRP
jgi:hypothetical protein